MIDPPVLEAVLRGLAGPLMALAEAELVVPDVPGLYAFHGGPDAWRELGLGDPLASRDVRTQFATGRTGSSTIRRSLAGLLADVLDLRGRPRNAAVPQQSANLGLEPAGDARLTTWMIERLRLAVWPAPRGLILDEVETAVLAQVAARAEHRQGDVALARTGPAGSQEAGRPGALCAV